MSKFKIGDKVRCIKSYRDHITIGCTYEVLDVTGGMYLHVDTGDRIIGVGGYAADRFELVQAESEYLTPEQVLQYFKEGRQSELEYIQPNGITLNNMTEYTGLKYLFEGEWRIKSVPKTIDYYGTELPKPIDISDLDESTIVYIPQLHRNSVYSMEVWEVKRLPYYGGSLHFSTYADARLVLDTIRKPFKQ